VHEDQQREQDIELPKFTRKKHSCIAMLVKLVRLSFIRAVQIVSSPYVMSVLMVLQQEENSADIARKDSIVEC
jgi:hypothetical protein